jgi:hypothetical protein
MTLYWAGRGYVELIIVMDDSVHTSPPSSAVVLAFLSPLYFSCLPSPGGESRGSILFMNGQLFKEDYVQRRCSICICHSL